MDQRDAKTRSRRSPTAEQLRSWRVFIETAEQVRSVMESRLLAESGLSSGDYGVLLALSESPGRRVRSSALAERIGWERSRLSHHLARMQKRGLVDRKECVTDNRGAEVVLTTLGATTFRRASAPHLRAIQDIFVDALTPAQLDGLEDAVSALRAHIKHS